MGIKEGWMVKQGGRWKSWRKRYFVLSAEGQSGKMVYWTKHPEDDKAIEKGVFTIQSLDCSVEANKDKADKHEITLTTPERVWQFRPDTDEDMNSWITAIKRFTDETNGGAAEKDTRPPQMAEMQQNGSFDQ